MQIKEVPETAKEMAWEYYISLTKMTHPNMTKQQILNMYHKNTKLICLKNKKTKKVIRIYKFNPHSLIESGNWHIVSKGVWKRFIRANPRKRNLILGYKY